MSEHVNQILLPPKQEKILTSEAKYVQRNKEKSMIAWKGTHP